ncbi:MAG: patatin-like phospholipase family protein [Bacteroidota bacterium]
MEVSDYLNQPELDKLIQEARFIRNSGKKFSDIEDASGLQYVDLVLEAQGITFMSLLGYTFILEEAGINFFNLGGVSSGALNAMIVAALGHQQYKSIYILKALNKRSFDDIQQGRSSGGSTQFMRKVSQLKNQLFPKHLKSVTLDKDDKREWISSVLREVGINDLAQLNETIRQRPNGLKHIFGGNISDLSPRLAIITSDITTHTKVELPKMAELYWSSPENVSPVEVVLASMAIPYFHNPYTIDNIPQAGDRRNKQWMDFANYHDEIPETVRFMDGSMIYQPPFNISHR